MKMTFAALSLLGAAALGGCGAAEDVTAQAQELTTDKVPVKEARPGGNTPDVFFPGGSWIQTCPSYSIHYDNSGNAAQMSADCYNKHHGLVHNEVWVWDCGTGCYWNNDGHLTCGNC
jgi:hypothetical protein